MRGVGVIVGANGRVERVQAVGNGSIGIAAGPGSTVTGNMANDSNIGTGISAGPGSTVSGNTARSNSLGISVVCPSAVIGNTATDNPGGNLTLFGTGCVTANNAAP